MNTLPDAGPKRGRGRPRTRPDGLRKHRLDLTDTEAEECRTAAALAGLTLSEFYRRAVLDTARKSAGKKTG